MFSSKSNKKGRQAATRKQLQIQSLEDRRLMAADTLQWDGDDLVVAISGKQSTSWRVTGHEISSTDSPVQTLPWRNLNTIEVTANGALTGSELTLYGTKADEDANAPTIPTTFLGASDGVASWSFEDLPNGRYLLDVRGQDPIAFSVLPGGASASGTVDRVGFAAFVTLARNFGETTEVPSGSDFNGDGVTNLLDFGILAGNYGRQLPGFELAPSKADLLFDFGDAPDTPRSSSTYHTLLSNDGARHRIVEGGPILGARIDAEGDGQPSALADKDDAVDRAFDDEDGLLELRTLGTLGRAIVEVSADLDTSPLLDGWIDFNSDGDWDDEGEQIFKNRAVVDGINELDFDVPASAIRPGSGSMTANGKASDTFLRLRLSTQGDLAPSGPADDGEVEDYGLARIPTIIDIPEENDGPGVPVPPGGGPDGGGDDGGDDNGGGDDGGDSQQGAEAGQGYGVEITEIPQDDGTPEDFEGTEIPDSALEDEPATRPITEILEEIKAAEEAGAEHGLDILHDELKEARNTQVTDIQADELLGIEGAALEQAACRLAELIAGIRGFEDCFPYAELIKKLLIDARQDTDGQSLTVRVNPDDSIQLISEDADGGLTVTTARFGQTTEFGGQERSGLIVYAPTLNPQEQSTRRVREYLPNCQRLEWKTEAIENGLQYVVEFQTHTAGGWVTFGSEVVETMTAGERKSLFRYVYENPGEAATAAGEGLVIGVKATTNGIVDGVTSFVTIGLVSDGPDVFELSSSDRFHGADVSVKLASGSTQIGIGLLGGPQNFGTKVIQVLDTANNATTLGSGVVDVTQNGVTVENGLETGVAALGLKANLSGAGDAAGAARAAD